MDYSVKTWTRKIVGENLKRIRQEQCLTPKKMCVKLGLPETMTSYISNIEHGKQGLSESQIKKFAEQLNINIAEFYVGITRPEEIEGFPLTNSEKQLMEDFRQLPDTFKVNISRICNSAKTLMPLSEDEIKRVEKIRHLDIKEIKTLEEVLNRLIEPKEK